MPFPFTTYSADMINHLLPGQRAMQDILIATDTEAVSAAGALSVTVPVTELSVTGTVAYTLADGPAGVSGMRKIIHCVGAASTPLGTLTIASPDTTTGFVCSSTFLFTTVGQVVELLWTGTKWRATRVQRRGFRAAVVGTTVLTGFNLENFNLSVTGTVASTGTQGIPNGSAAGEILEVGCGTAASTPHGDIAITIVGSFGTAGTTLDDYTATTDAATLMWNGAAWQVLQLRGATLAVV